MIFVSTFTHTFISDQILSSRTSYTCKSTTKLENIAIANALQLEAARRRAVPIRFDFIARAEFELAQPIPCRLRAFYCLYDTLRCDLDL